MLLYQSVRFDPKDFKQRKPNGKGEWAWNISGVRLVLYRLPQLLKRQTETVFFPKGKRTFTPWKVGVVASCNPGGWQVAAWYSEALLGGRHVVILPDNDEPGRKHAAAVAAALLSVAASVRIVELPGLPAKGDVTDWRDAGGTFEQFRELAESAAPLDAAGLSELRARWGLADGEPHPHGARRSGGRLAEARTDPKRTSARASLLRRPSSGFVPAPGGGRGGADASPDGLSGGGDGALSCRCGEPAGHHSAEGERYRVGGCAEPLGRHHRATWIHEVPRHSGGYPSPESDSDRMAAASTKRR